MTTRLVKGYHVIQASVGLRLIHWLLGIMIHIPAWLYFQLKKRKQPKSKDFLDQQLTQQLSTDYDQRIAYFNRASNEQKKQAFIAKEYALVKKTEQQDHVNYTNYFEQLLQSRLFLLLTLVPGLLLYLFYLVYHHGLIRFIFERLVATIFVIFSVIVIVFTLLYFSPQDPAQNILGDQATAAQRENFEALFGLDQPYFTQLTDRLLGFITFDLGTTYQGYEDVLLNIENRFPVTLTLAFLSLVLAIAIAVPIGIISAVKVNSFWDYSFMFVALIGLSIPSFWQGLIFILTFAIELDWLPSTYIPGQLASLIMPVIVLGTGLSATIARMTRSEILEVMHEDYIVTAKAKGLLNRRIFTKHALPNAWIPILTVIGLQFGAMLGGASVTEKVFNIQGLGSYIVDKQFIPDIPAILAGVVYIAVMISVVNLLVDLLYALLNPRLRAELND
jgi:peptide/nickel transport system permease protein